MRKRLTKMSKTVLSFALAAAMVMGLSGMSTLAADSEASGLEEAVETQTIIVKEQVNGYAESGFSFSICQVTESNYPIKTIGGDDSDIHSAVAGADLFYTIYDSLTDELLDTGTTDADGAFSLEDGSYAVFTVEAGTDWYVKQNTTEEYPLAEEDGVTAEGTYASVVTSVEDEGAIPYGIVQYEPVEEPEPTAKGDKEALREAYDDGLTLDESEYTAESWEPFEAAMEKAKEVLDNEDATQEEIDAALAELEEARDGLKKAESEPTPAAPTVTISSGLADNEKTYDGEAVTLTAEVKGSEDAALTYQWYLYDEETGAFAAIEGATKSTYTLAGDVSDSGMYRCTVTATDADGNKANASASVTITIEKAEQEISYEETLLNKTTDDGPFTNELTTGELSPEDGAGITYASSEEEVAEVDPATGEVTIRAAGTVVITATAAGTANYAEATATYVIEITAPTSEPTPEAPAVTISSGLEGNAKTYDGKAVTLTAEAEGSEGTILTYQWSLYDEETEEFVPIEDATESTYTLAGDASDSGIYRCTVTATDADGNEASASAVVTITIEKAEQEISYEETLLNKTTDDGPFTNELTIGKIFPEDGAGITYASSEEAIAEVDPETGEVTIHAAGTVVITATAAGTENYAEATATYVIEIKEPTSEPTVNKDALREEYDEDSELNESDYTPESWELFAAAMLQAKEVLADEDADQEEVDAALAVLKSAREGLQKVPEQPTVTDVSITAEGLLDDNTKTYNGEGVTLTASATVEPEDADVSYQWYKDGTEIVDATDDTLTLAGNVSDTGSYTCTVTATASNGETAAATSDALAIAISRAKQDISFADESVIKTVGDNAFTNELTQTLVDFVGGAKVTYSISGENGVDTDKIATIDPDNGEVTIVGAGTVTVTATASETNNYDSAEASYKLTVVEPEKPTIIDVTVISNLEGNEKDYDGKGFSLTVTAEVTPDDAEVTYQWYKDGTLIEGKTDKALALDGNVSDTGSYTCTVTATLSNGQTDEATSDALAVTISQAKQDISYEDSTVLKYDYDEPFTITLTKTLVFGNITYAYEIQSGDLDIAIDENGKVTINGGTGVARITATAAGSDNYEKAEASYLLTVNEDKIEWKVESDQGEVKKDESKEEYIDDLTYTGDPIKLSVSLTLTEEEQESMDAISFQWYRYDPDTQALDEIAGANEAFYILEGDEVNAGEYIYVCMAVLTYQNGYEHSVYCPVEVDIARAKQDISFADESVIKIVGDDAFTNELTQTVVDFTGGAKITYSISGENGVDTDKIATIDPDSGEVTIVGAGTVTVTATASETDNYDSAEASYKLTVVEPEKPTIIDVSIASNLEGNEKDYDGKGFSLTVTAEVTPDDAEVTYQWYKDGTLIEGETDKTLTLDGNVSDTGSYTCTVTATLSNGQTDEATSDALAVTISQAKQDISFADESVIKTVGDEDFTNELTQTVVDFAGGAKITYSISGENGVDTDKIATIDPASGLVKIVGAGTVTVTATASETENYEMATATYTLTIKQKLTVDLTVTAVPEEMVYDEEAEILLTASAAVEPEEAPDSLTYQWYKVVGDDKYEKVENETSSYLAITDVLDSGTYLCVVTATYGTQTATAYDMATATITKADQTIVFTEESVTLSVDDTFKNEIADGSVVKGDLTYKSSNPDVAIVDETSGDVTIVGVGSATIIATAEATDNYNGVSSNYTIEANDAGLSVTVSSDLDGNNKPYDGDPVILTAEAGSSVAGTTFTYQWYKEDETGDYEELPGEDAATLTLSGNVDDTGTYKCVVTATYPNGEMRTADGSVTVTITDPEALDYNVKYAVRIFGICADSYSLDDGTTIEVDKASLTFGPATGDLYWDTYVSCGSDTCIHKLSWEQITDLCEQNKGNETALRELFGSCLENGCTTSVKVNMNETLGRVDDDTGEIMVFPMDGDGVGQLNDSFNTDCQWRNWFKNGSGTYLNCIPRATLNGKTSNTSDPNEAPDAEDCLLTCFPEELQEAIVPKQVVYWSSSGRAANIYDNLWLFSGRELFGSKASSSISTLAEGTQYEYMKNKGVGTGNHDVLASYREGLLTGTMEGSWLSRSPDTSKSGTYSYYFWLGSGSSGMTSTGRQSGGGLAPGFCIK